jgi:hypothetical protein
MKPKNGEKCSPTFKKCCNILQNVEKNSWRKNVAENVD